MHLAEMPEPAIPMDPVRPARSTAAVITALVITQFVASDGITGIYVMLPAIYREFPNAGATVPWIVTSYFLMAAMIAAVGGRLADLLGRRTIAIVFLLVAVVGSAIGAVATQPWMLIVASVLLATTTTLTPILIGIARENLHADKVGLAIGAIAAAGSAGAGLVFLLVGVIVDHFGRQGGYLLTTILAIGAIVLLLASVPRPVRSKTPLSDIDFVRGVLFGPAVAGMILAVEVGSSRGWSDAVAPLLFVGSLALALYWVRNQLTQARPLLNLRVMAHGAIPRTLFVMLILGVAGVQQGQIFSLILQQNPASGAGFGLSGAMAGLMMVPINGTAAVVAPLGGWLARRYGPSPVALAGSLLIAVAWAICAFTFGSLVPLVLSAMLSLAGLSLLMPSNHLLIVEATPPDMTSGAVGLSFTLFDLGFAIGAQVLLGLLMHQTDGIAVPPGPADYRFAFLWLAAGSTLMVIAPLIGMARTSLRTRSRR